MVIELTLTIQEINLILATLSKEPYIQVVDLIKKIHDQANPQVNQDGITNR